MLVSLAYHMLQIIHLYTYIHIRYLDSYLNYTRFVLALIHYLLWPKELALILI